MKVRVPAAILLIAALFLAACGGESDEEKAQKAIAEAIEEASKDIDKAADDKAADDKADDQSTDDQAAGDASDDQSGDDSSDSDMPDLENMGECMEIGFSYAALGLVSLGGMMGSGEVSDADLAELKSTIDDLTEKLPKDIQADFAIVAEAYNTAAKEGFMSSKGQAALESDEFTEANDKVAAYIEDLCE